MANYYLDIETTGFNPINDKIITIQYRKVNSRGEFISDLVVLKEWESSEEDIVSKFHTLFMNENVWEFVPILTNHIFDLTFLFKKFKKYNLKCPELSDFLYTKPFIDIKYTLIMANNLSFKGSGLDNITNKKIDGRQIPEWYKNKDYTKIVDYIVMETESFIEFFKKVVSFLPTLKALK